MQAAKLPARAGWQWIRDGLMLFRRQPLPIFTWAMSISLTLMLASLLPPVGPLLIVILVPTIGFLTLSICRHIDAGRTVAPSMWLQPLQRKGLLWRLIGMGALYGALSLVAGLLIPNRIKNVHNFAMKFGGDFHGETSKRDRAH